jgi:hypothetical protein
MCEAGTDIPTESFPCIFEMIPTKAELVLTSWNTIFSPWLQACAAPHFCPGRSRKVLPKNPTFALGRLPETEQRTIRAVSRDRASSVQLAQGTLLGHCDGDWADSTMTNIQHACRVHGGTMPAYLQRLARPAPAHASDDRPTAATWLPPTRRYCCV